MDNRTLLQLVSFIRGLQVADSALPVGGFAFSNGLETAIEHKLVTDSKTLTAYVYAILNANASLDGVGFIHAFQAAAENDYQRILAVDNALSIRRVGEEQQLMAIRMGKKLAELTLKFSSCELLTRWLDDINQQLIQGNYAVALAIYLAAEKLTQSQAFMIHQYGLASMILNAAIRLMRIDHVQTQHILYQAASVIAEDYQRVSDIALEDMATFTPVFDVLVACHAQGEVRLFMN